MYMLTNIHVTRCRHSRIHTHTLKYTDKQVLLLEGGGDEEGVLLRVFVLSDLDVDLRNSNADLVEEP
jgi:hypothetical protein